MKYKTALGIIGDNPIGLLTWGAIILPPANAKLSKIHKSVTMDHTGNELLVMLEGLEDRDRIMLLESIVDVDSMTVQPAPDPNYIRTHNTMPYVLAISGLVITVALVLYDLMSKDTILDGKSLGEVLRAILQMTLGSST